MWEGGWEHCVYHGEGNFRGVSVCSRPVPVDWQLPNLSLQVKIIQYTLIAYGVKGVLVTFASTLKLYDPPSNSGSPNSAKFTLTFGNDTTLIFVVAR